MRQRPVPSSAAYASSEAAGRHLRVRLLLLLLLEEEEAVDHAGTEERARTGEGVDMDAVAVPGDCAAFSVCTWKKKLILSSNPAIDYLRGYNIDCDDF